MIFEREREREKERRVKEWKGRESSSQSVLGPRIVVLAAKD